MGASADSIHSHRVFAQALGGVPYPLVSDWHRTLAASYGVLDADAGRARRSIFVIDQQGVLRYANTQFNARERRDYEAVIQFLQGM